MARPDWDPQAYTVKRGDTLYSIAWRYEKDFRELAEWNDIKPPYAIYPGQRLAMQPVNTAGTVGSDVNDDKELPMLSSAPEIVPAVDKYPVEPVTGAETVIVQKGDTLYSIARSEGFTVKQLARWNALKSPYHLYPNQLIKLTPPAISAITLNTPPDTIIKEQKEIIKNEESAPIKTEIILPAKVNSWAWPVKGKILSTFKYNDTGRKGIVIAGNRGQDIRASAAGKVVYSGNGLISYGNLIIIKHSNSYLSAYAYNRKLLVKEGESVVKGQAIAHMGSVDNGRSQLHFEIRKNGKPVNPMEYLPKI
ncbi:MAG: LysM peptidoglycan-binding domain-containing protein [Gammaproteobacteria bacterium]|nr:LysM peptidoglycan-binding domain-containing protein [Gammaproteobacteria bacterium]MDH5735375.1 LysM peptidoglycan-binding domain-containing protein [Gammaproteobacteria bacterium]